jgi:PhzF family phenazine biosynthesis protein
LLLFVHKKKCFLSPIIRVVIDMPSYVFQQVDVFSAVPLKGNALAVVVGADGLTDAQMMAFANWTNLSETTFLLKPVDERADYRVRIFTPQRELPFAGHPTLGSCHVWLANGGVPKAEKIVQECGVGLVEIKRVEGRLAFAAPPLRRSEGLEPELLSRVTASLRVSEAEIVAANWLDNGAPWIGVMLKSREEVLALEPDFMAMGDLWVGVIGPAEGPEVQFEVRGFSASEGFFEDPVTGSLNAGLARWLIGAGLAPAHYVAGQGTALGRDGRIYVSGDGDSIWVGGDVVTCVEGTMTL